MAFHVVFFVFTLSFLFTSFREQDETYINSLRWPALVGLEPAYIHILFARSTSVLRTPANAFHVILNSPVDNSMNGLCFTHDLH